MIATHDFQETLGSCHEIPLRRGELEILQVNVGKLCNQACHHCHVDAGPGRKERMTRATAERLVELLRRSPGVGTVDLTGGAPELNAHFRFLVESARAQGLRVIDRCNLTILSEPGMDWVGPFLRDARVEVVSSLPCYLQENVDRQRGDDVFDRSISALQQLKSLGYGRADTGLKLDLVYNPLGPSLPSPQAQLEEDYKRELGERFGIEFNQLYTITNMPIRRFARMLAREGRAEEYMGLLVHHFNPGTLPGLMCRNTLSVSWDGRLYDCDFNQMLDLDLGGQRTTIWDLESLSDPEGGEIAVANHCFGCTAGAGSSCGGALS